MRAQHPPGTVRAAPEFRQVHVRPGSSRGSSRFGRHFWSAVRSEWLLRYQFLQVLEVHRSSLESSQKSHWIHLALSSTQTVDLSLSLVIFASSGQKEALGSALASSMALTACACLCLPAVQRRCGSLSKSNFSTPNPPRPHLIDMLQQKKDFH